ncbi:hypothetical protein N2152v2_008824 [Parachlorella kessleri]
MEGGLYSDDPQELTTAQVLRRAIPWDIYKSARFISDRELQLIKRYDKKDASYQAKLLAEAGSAYVEAFETVLKNVAKDETVQYVLALLEDMLDADSDRAALFHQRSDLQQQILTDPYTIFLRLLQRNDWYTQEKACQILTAIFQARPEKEQLKTPAAAAGGGSPVDGGASTSAAAGASAVDPVTQAMTTFVDWLCSQLRRPSHPSSSVPVTVHALSVVLREGPVRVMAQRAGAPALLAPLVAMPSNGSPLNVQLLYEAALCVWQLSFYKPAAEALSGTEKDSWTRDETDQALTPPHAGAAPAISATGVVGGLVDMVRSAAKEKLVRIALLALQNLLTVGPTSLEYAVVDKGLPKAVANRLLQNWDDEDIPLLLEWVDEQLAEGILQLSSFERYKKELLAGTFNWSPLHDQESFWLENSERLVDNNCQLLRVLMKLIETSRDTTTLAVACHDLAQFITYYPHGRGIVGELRGKELVMRLMMHPDGDVQKEALLCVQKVLISKDKLNYLQGIIA